MAFYYITKYETEPTVLQYARFLFCGIFWELWKYRQPLLLVLNAPEKTMAFACVRGGAQLKFYLSWQVKFYDCSNVFFSACEGPVVVLV